MSHGNIVERHLHLHRFDGVVLVYVRAAHVDKDYLFEACRVVLFTELDAILKSKMPLWMAHAHIVVAEVVQEGVVVVVAFDHNAVDVSETEVDSCGVGNE